MRSHVCEKCHRIFKQKSHLDDHMKKKKSCADQYMFAQNIPNFDEIEKINNISHITQKITNKKMQCEDKCKILETSFLEKNLDKKKIQEIDVDDVKNCKKKCKCIYCDATFTRKGSAKYHILHSCPKIKEIVSEKKSVDNKESNDNKKKPKEILFYKSSKSNEQIIDPEVVDMDTDFIDSFYDNNDISQFIDLNVVYIGVIGKYKGKILMKFGKSGRVFDRDCDEHRKTYGKQFKIVFVIYTDNNTVVEDTFRKVIKSKKINPDLYLNNVQQKELFVTNDKFTIEDAKETLENIVKKNPLKSIQERDNKIKELENTNALMIEKEKTKRLELKLQFLKLKLKAKNNKIELSDIDSDLDSES